MNDYYIRNKERIQKRQKIYRQNNKEKISKAGILYMKKLKERLSEEQLQILLDNKRRYGRTYYKKNKETINIKAKERNKSSYFKGKYRLSNTKLKRVYGISMDDYDVKLKKQKGVCAICSGIDIDRNLVIDHNHTTGAIRGLLCNKCNLALGLFKDDIAILKSSIKYIRKYEN